ncbi:hypothetical protein RhiirA4_465047 [Rhizophagus irregularis]|uniref:Uncharacterized protein n=1 Tax=Rhizophagus irregularis TaxID=588596 RepID=A0A2I1GRA5_9GLOM|nr:hypothetical protein RhiirA4_465047 [Rhizophagus irregularis]
MSVEGSLLNKYNYSFTFFEDDENIGLEYEDIEKDLELSEQNPENSKQNSKRNSNKNSGHRKKESESELSDII